MIGSWLLPNFVTFVSGRFWNFFVVQVSSTKAVYSLVVYQIAAYSCTGFKLFVIDESCVVTFQPHSQGQVGQDPWNEVCSL